MIRMIETGLLFISPNHMLQGLYLGIMLYNHGLLQPRNKMTDRLSII